MISVLHHQPAKIVKINRLSRIHKNLIVEFPAILRDAETFCLTLAIN
jgi:hypothetical protein